MLEVEFGTKTQDIFCSLMIVSNSFDAFMVVGFSTQKMAWIGDDATADKNEADLFFPKLTDHQTRSPKEK